MERLEKLKKWLMTFPGCQDLEWILTEFADGDMRHAGLFSDGIRELDRREDVLGNVWCRCRWSCRICLSRPRRDGTETAAESILEFSEWVRRQSLEGLTPRLGQNPSAEKAEVRAPIVRSSPRPGMVTYTIPIILEYEDIYEVKE